MSQTDRNSEALSQTALSAYAGPAVPLAMVFVPLVVFLPPFYASELGLSLQAVGLIFLVARFWDALTDPLIGGFSDRTSSRFGRRKPWMAVGMPLMMISGWFLLVPPDDISSTYLFVAIILFYIAWTMVQVPYLSWGSEVTSNYQERTRIASFREGGTVVGTVLAMGIPLLLVDPNGAGIRDWLLGLIGPASGPISAWLIDLLTPDAFSLGQILRIIATAMLCLLPITILLAFKATPEHPGLFKSNTPSWAESLKLLGRNKPFARLLAGYFVIQAGFASFLAMVQFFVVFALQLPTAYLLLVFLQQLLAILTIPFWVKVTGMIGKHRAYCLSGIVIILGLAVLLVIEPGNKTQAVWAFLFMGLIAASKIILPPAIAADTVDYDSLRTKSGQAGLYLALLNLTNKAALAVAIGVPYLLLAWTGFDPQSKENTEAAITGLRYMTTLFPMAIIALGVIIMWRFPLTQERHGVIARRLKSLSARSERVGTASE